ncbi:hypothetical protein PFICI_04347 [Pestalotiopsis fici W106-1]|uniref:Heterokaryon incompatibility domain-containing protein n=1 Tax=Pestalotiopsis fici (strain W106-1 / CGMCC3.15140) TaxID=1229662 RepID=W3XBA4_PESFW|nr:uncharacterized protein PFICI_04347 [Pestalotiopsis fici W106-1]ETS82471.1 hypothetical protein PFICI_04347 [Pestalotiopsis fici W106-1]
MKSKWAERMWTLQEAVWSNSLLVFTGEAIFDLRGVHHLGEARLNEDIAGDWAGPNGVLSELRRRCNDTILADRALVSTWAEPWECVPTLAENIDTLLEVAAHRQCARPNDKIYALLGLTKHNDFWITYNESVESTLIRAINAGVVSWPVLTMVKTEEGSQNCWMPNLKEAVRVPEANSSIRTIDMVEQMIKLDGFIADTEELKSQVEIPDSHSSNQILLVVPGIGGTDSLAMRAEVVKDRVLHRTGAWRIKMSEELKNAHQEEIGTYLVGATLLQA